MISSVILAIIAMTAILPMSESYPGIPPDPDMRMMKYNKDAFEVMWRNATGDRKSKKCHRIGLMSQPMDFHEMDYAHMEPVEDIDEDMDLEMGRSITPTDSKLWVNTVTYQIDMAFSASERDSIMGAMQELANGLPCLQFQVVLPGSTRIPDYPHVFINKQKSGCFSQVGRIGNGRQNMNLAAGCYSKGTIQHEMIHSLGIHHEQVRPDRDNYVTIYLDNVGKTHVHNFNKWKGSRTFGFDYDYYSVMHYSDKAFSTNGEKTMRAKKSGIKLGSRGVLTKTDWLELGNLYNCFGDVYHRLFPKSVNRDIPKRIVDFSRFRI